MPDDPTEPAPTSHEVKVVLPVALESSATVRATITAHLEVTPYENKLLEKARNFIGAEEFGLAVVLAHTACEVCAERTISQAFASKGVAHLEKPIMALFLSCNLGNERLRNLYNALTGRKIEAQPFWKAFKDSTARRNRAIHAGSAVSKVDAEASCNAARDLIAFLRSP